MPRHIELERHIGAPFFTKNIISMDSEDPLYKKKRKALPGAFFKNKVEKMTMSVKEELLRTFRELQAEGAEVTKDLNRLTCHVQSVLIVSILVGQKYAQMKVPHIDMATGETS